MDHTCYLPAFSQVWRFTWMMAAMGMWMWQTEAPFSVLQRVDYTTLSDTLRSAESAPDAWAVATVCMTADVL